ncbi:MAG TPA: hypothetical protein VE870_00025 [Bacteroidales bacterium]|nr:hypothetical protein [Bacteroidales bacterium]
MEIIRKEKFLELARKEDDNLISVCIPTHSHGKEVNEKQDSKALKSALKSVTNQLAEKGKNKSDIEKITQPVRELIDDSSFWRHQRKGLAIFASENFFEKYTLPQEPEYVTYSGHKFYLKPLLSMIDKDGKFFLLTISKSGVKLFHCSRFDIEEVDLNNKIPDSIKETLKFDVPERSIQAHSGDRKESLMFHGHGVMKDEDRKNLLRFFHQVDRGIMQIVHERQIPMVIAGLGHLVPVYREASSYPGISNDFVDIDPDSLNIDKLHSKAKSIAEQESGKLRKNSLKRYQKLAGTRKTTIYPSEIISSAYYKNVDTLFVRDGAELWGTFDKERYLVDTNPDNTQNHEELVNFAIIHTILNGGEVLITSDEEFPAGPSKMAAILRSELV